MNRVLLVDDDEKFLEVYSEILISNGYETATAPSGEECLKKLRAEFFNIVIIDVLMPVMNGIELLKLIQQEYSSLIVLVLTGEGSISGAVEAMELGAFTYMLKPLEIEVLLHNLKRAEQFYILNSENISLKNRLPINNKTMLLGESAFIKETIKQIEQVSSANSSVLITGESGTGKEIIADLIHFYGKRALGPLVKVNCGALSESLLESELFGYEKGAFTGATARKIGFFELSNRGTLFLDEIGDMSANLQQKLLRVIQEKTFERVGSTQVIRSDFRLICATNKDLREEIKKGNFREDLFYRINVIPIKTVPLRRRKEDIPVLLEYYISYFCREMNKHVFKITDEALEDLMNYEWLGNVREVKNFCERLTVFSNGNDVSTKVIKNYIEGDTVWENTNSNSTYKEAEKDFQYNFLLKKLEENNWNISKTAEILKISRKTLQLKIKELKIRECNIS